MFELHKEQCIIDICFMCSWNLLLFSFIYFWPCHMGSATAAAAKSLQSCPTLYDPIDGSPPGSPVPGILQARILEWVAISVSIPSYSWMLKGWFKRGQFAPTRCIDLCVGGTRYKGSSLQMWLAFYILSWALLLWFCLGSSVWLPSSACVAQPG